MPLNLKTSLLFLLPLFLPLASCHIDVEENDIGNDHRSRATVLEYPDIYEIGNTPKVFKAMDAAWKEMLYHCTNYARLEIGFYIYYDRDKKDYIIGEWKYGPLVTYAEECAYIDMGKPVNYITVCAFFHCHPPSYTIKGRPTGPSKEDEALANNLGIPGIVYDYYADHITYLFPYDEYKDDPCPYLFGPRQKSPYTIY